MQETKEVSAQETIKFLVEENKQLRQEIAELHKSRASRNEIEKLLNEIELLRKEKEEERLLRAEAEKQIELALQKTMEIQKRMDDWKIIQNSSIKDSRNAIIAVGDDLYQKLLKALKP